MRGRPYDPATDGPLPQPIHNDSGQFIGWQLSNGQVFAAVRDAGGYRPVLVSGPAPQPYIPAVSSSRQQSRPALQNRHQTMHQMGHASAGSPFAQHQVADTAVAAGPSQLQGHATTYPGHSRMSASGIPWVRFRPRGSPSIDVLLEDYRLTEDILDARQLRVRLYHLMASFAGLIRAHRNCREVLADLRERSEYLTDHACYGCGCGGSHEPLPGSGTVTPQQLMSQGTAQPDQRAPSDELSLINWQAAEELDFSPE